MVSTPHISSYIFSVKVLSLVDSQIFPANWKYKNATCIIAYINLTYEGNKPLTIYASNFYLNTSEGEYKGNNISLSGSFLHPVTLHNGQYLIGGVGFIIPIGAIPEELVYKNSTGQILFSVHLHGFTEYWIGVSAKPELYNTSIYYTIVTIYPFILSGQPVYLNVEVVNYYPHSNISVLNITTSPKFNFTVTTHNLPSIPLRPYQSTTFGLLIYPPNESYYGNLYVYVYYKVENSTTST
ncbi:hypothetical protein GFS03_04700 [Sulfolobus sp. E5-1-F]|uniref:hypothetical protein n=1 Tax=Saccharolobus sp. E5-1-F TaxID=2663019 RepID=UPI001295F404|nr:hypothetical protein [Sulfolobus sp. E5-1-F]QGA53924.1 hypothetical protein GFS03_04700 [Sulfolobus sp. E5-1-F]